MAPKGESEPMWRPLKLIPGLVLSMGLACLVIGAIAVATLQGAENDQTALFPVGFILASIGVGLLLHSRP